VRIDIWSDIACPWCAVGKANLDAALLRFPHPVEVVWRSFELDPGAPAVKEGDYVQLLSRKYGTSLPDGQSMIDRMVATARASGVTLDFTRIRPGNTFDAHRVVHLAAERGLQGPVKERFLRGYLSEGAAIGDHEEITRLAVDAGLQESQVREVLASQAYAEQVRDDEQQAMDLGCSGVPFFVMGGRVAVPGAQSADTLLRALEKAWELTQPVQLLEGVAVDAEVCGPEGCAAGPATARA
jgi:predicted DsbA family dithiol-disulfide isomerase